VTGGGREAKTLLCWVDAQLPPQLGDWLSAVPYVEARHVLELGLIRASDRMIWEAARAASAVVITKDTDFRDRALRLGPPPQVVWVTAGNLSNRVLQDLIGAKWPEAVQLLRQGEPLVEIARAKPPARDP
jgi:predicted nuclease of predicted toxin-antitoxin system